MLGFDAVAKPRDVRVGCQVVEVIGAVRDDHRKARSAYQDELAVVTGQLAAKDTAVDKYLADFEDNKIGRQVVARRVAQLSGDIDQLRHRRDALILALDVEPEASSDTELAEARQHLAEIIRTADLPERQALCDALIEELRLNANVLATPVFRTPTLSSAGTCPPR